MNGMVGAQMVNQGGLISQAPGMMPQSSMPQQSMIQTMPQNTFQQPQQNQMNTQPNMVSFLYYDVSEF
jgi:hypothetical protein